jgi:DNA mismatch endonuclease, patch repair protein
MQSVGTRDTGPEMTVRRLLHGLGFRYRLHSKRLPGKPDIVFPVRKKAIFVHGCFWHGHDCAKGQLPKSRREYWEPKLKTNIARDAAQVIALQALGWSALTVWQCETTVSRTLTKRLVRFIEGRPRSANNRKQIG